MHIFVYPSRKPGFVPYIQRLAVLASTLFVLWSCGSVPPDSSGSNRTNQSDIEPTHFLDQSSLQEFLQVLAHDSLGGRGTGHTGAEKTVEYLTGFYENDLFMSQQGYRIIDQPFGMHGMFWDKVTYRLSMLSGNDTLLVSEHQIPGYDQAPVYPVMNGYEQTEGRIIFKSRTDRELTAEEMEEIRMYTRDQWIMVFAPDLSAGHQQRTPLEDIQRLMGYYDAAGVILIQDGDEQEWQQQASYFNAQIGRPLTLRREGQALRFAPRSSGNAVSIHPQKALQIFGFSDISELDSLRGIRPGQGEPVHVLDTGKHFTSESHLEQRPFTERNIGLVIPGRHADKSDEVIVITAHYDHMGYGSPNQQLDIIYNGADDNASGTAAVMALAEAFARAAEQGIHPDRTLLFLHVAAEEWGLIGARYYVQNPEFPLEQTVANINLDMIGFIDNEYIHKEDQDYVYVIGAGLFSNDMQHHLDVANERTVSLTLDYTYNTTNHPMRLYRRSDHWAFAEQNIPFVFLFSGLHDYYHTPDDTVDRIDWDRLAKRTELASGLIWELTQTPERPRLHRQVTETGR